jgi:hypothetical protein
MPKQRLRSFAITATACWLVLLASGDDLNFARLVLPESDTPLEDVTTLDDPNLDFTESGVPPTLRQCQLSNRRNVSRTAAPALSTPTNNFGPRTDRHIPLRC